MNQKSNTLTIDLNIHFEGSLELRNIIKWLVPIAFAIVRLTILLYGGS